MTARAQLEDRLHREAAKRRDAGLTRSLGSSFAAPFSHNDYLGLRHHPRMRQVVEQALASGVSVGSTGSRLLSGNHPAFAALEDDCALAMNSESALFFGSASEANRAAVTALCGRHDTVILDELAHASLWDGAVHSGAKRLRFAHNDPADLRRVLRSESAHGQRLVLVESLYSMDGDVAPLAELLTVCQEEGALLLIDEAHGAGIYGPHCTGRSETLPKSDALVAVVLGCGKALASAGGVLCMPSALREQIVNTCREFIFTTGPSPLSAVAAHEALRISRSEPAHRTRLMDLCTYFADGLRAQGVALPERSVPTAIFPIPCAGAHHALERAAALNAQGFGVRAIRSPTVPAGTERLRLTLSADLDYATLDALLVALRGS